MPGFIEGIAFMPPPREDYTDAQRIELCVGRMNLESVEEAAVAHSVGCFGSLSSSSSPSRGQQNRPGNANNNHILDGPDFDINRPYVSYTVAFPPGTSGISPKQSLQSGHKALLSNWSGKIIIFAHGNAEDLMGVLYYWRLAQQLGVAIVAYDYLGYGWSSGTKKDCTEGNAFKAIRRVFKFVTEDCNRERCKVILMGRSLGSGSATNLAYEECLRYSAELKNKNKQNGTLSSSISASATAAQTTANNSDLSTLGGLILYSPLYSAVAATGKLWASGIYGDIMCNYKKVGEIIKHCPILIVHGTIDEVIPFKCAVELFVKCGGVPKGKDGVDATESNPAPSEDEKKPSHRKAYFRPMAGCGHNNVESVMAPVYYQCVAGFLSTECLGRGPGRKLGTAAGGGGGIGMTALGKASKPVVSEDDPIWGKPK